MITANEARYRLALCHTERSVAIAEGLGGNATYLAHLDAEIAEWEDAYVLAAVTEIASFRSQLSGPQEG
jgi:hypothetical protein